MNASKLIQDAKLDESKIIRCTVPNGRNIDFGYAEIAEVWVTFVESGDAGQTTTQTAVRNAIQRCDPDVELIDKSESYFEVET